MGALCTDLAFGGVIGEDVEELVEHFKPGEIARGRQRAEVNLTHCGA